MSVLRRRAFPGRARDRVLQSFDPGLGLAALLLGHAGLGLAMRASETVGTLHAVATAAVGLGLALFGRSLKPALYLAAYVVGSEVLWRMTGTAVFWEYGKYTLSAILLVVALRARRSGASGLPILYFVLLLPSAIITLSNLEWDAARRQLSFNLSGPFALMVCVFVFWDLRVSRAELTRIFAALMAPAAGVGAIALAGVTSTRVSFNRGSNFASSGGFGPNQVSAVLALGALVALMWLLQDRVRPGLKAVLFAAITTFGAQSALTFSRGGLYFTGLAWAAGGFYYARGRQTRLRVAALSLAVLAVAAVLVVPRLESFTGGKLSDRFQDMDPTRREKIVQIELQAWSENPILGVGPGQLSPVRRSRGLAAAAHTEFSRLVGEHGLFGLAAALILLVIVAERIKRSRVGEERAMVVTMTAWSVLFMSAYAMRLAAPSFVCGLGCASFWKARAADRKRRQMAASRGSAWGRRAQGWALRARRRALLGNGVGQVPADRA